MECKGCGVEIDLTGCDTIDKEDAALAAAVGAKQEKDENRDWPDWRTVPKGRAIEHVR